MTTEARQVVILGAGGFVGRELLRLVLTHPRLRLAAAFSDSHAGRRIGDAHPQLAPFTDLAYRSSGELSSAPLDHGSWVVLAALDHGVSLQTLPRLLDDTAAADVQVVDMSGDFRLRDPAQYEDAYGRRHAAPALIPDFVYGLPELHRDLVAGARRIANPGCFATAAALALLPAAAAGWPVAGVALDGMTGSSGAGAAPRATTHHPLRASNLQAYRPLAHRHLPEIVQSWRLAGGDRETTISFVPHMAPLVRGIVVSAHLFLGHGVRTEEAAATYERFYEDAPFVRVLGEPPALPTVWGSNRCDVSVTARGRVVAVSAALDNLVKGAAGQALQNVNLMNGWDETTGLLAPVPSPV